MKRRGRGTRGADLGQPIRLVQPVDPAEATDLAHGHLIRVAPEPAKRGWLLGAAIGCIAVSAALFGWMATALLGWH